MHALPAERRRSLCNSGGFNTALAPLFASERAHQLLSATYSNTRFATARALLCLATTANHSLTHAMPFHSITRSLATNGLHQRLYRRRVCQLLDSTRLINRTCTALTSALQALAMARLFDTYRASLQQATAAHNYLYRTAVHGASSAAPRDSAYMREHTKRTTAPVDGLTADQLEQRLLDRQNMATLNGK